MQCYIKLWLTFRSSGYLPTVAIFIPELDIAAIDSKYNVRPFKQAEPSAVTGYNTVELEALDFSQYKDGLEGYESRKRLASSLEKSISTYGFFNITNWGFPSEDLEKLKSYSQAILDLPQEEKLQFLSGAMKTDLEDRSKSLGAERGHGFKPRGYWTINNGVQDSIEFYNFRDILHDGPFFIEKKYPEVAQAHLPEFASYYRYLHFNVLRRLLNLCDIILQLPEGYLWENHFKVWKGDLKMNSGSGVARLMHYLAMPVEDEEKTGGTWLRGHSDSGAFTFITSQPILSLQIRDYYTGEWKYVGHKPDSLIVNIGDAMEFLTGGYFKSSIHRVVAPPDDQRQFKRLVMIYFNNLALNTIADPTSLNSPKLRSLGFNKPEEWDTITQFQWDDEKSRLYGAKKINSKPGDEPELVKLFGRNHERWHQAEGDLRLEKLSLASV
ncbi:hypothetical protein BABINDRAFT_181124 [Babjeviella inositovora NRRL Y-12698]|uniref:Fe2OG dioxygenase domain-containing protein n=1 Tax=Babjeviella inositovora NRRL Y-12698 TaxID=984486 RepID=A0A1E3QLE5_9ASCO|nr:uncharacterized protein BABINDRAFT_181124 [Babjeviella inositovora NRRL Y-12698]ODQ78438.1 hypothetical protein BABINDRAFT_181124 [Babjeviella inositovora NRRL Y-12698]